MIYWSFARAATALLAFLFAVAATAAAENSPELLPSDPGMWLNSPPLTVEALKGKGVVLWFYEETCPSCRGKWPRMYELANKYQGQPVVFIAVNSGVSPADVQQYARDVKLSWPIIVDPTRQFEKQWLTQEISLQNIHQCELILPSGKKMSGRWNDLDASVKESLDGASWKIDPQTIPPVFMSTWRSVELGNYPAAADLLKKGLVTKNAEVKEAATRVNAVVQDQLRSASEAAANVKQEGNAWRSYQLYSGITKTFAGYGLPPEIAATQKDLAGDAKVKQQLDASKALDGIRKAMPTARTEVAQKRIVTRLQQLVSQFPETDAATEARGLLNEAGQQP